MSPNSLAPVSQIEILRSDEDSDTGLYTEETIPSFSPVIYIQSVHSPFASPLCVGINKFLKRTVDVIGSLICIAAVLSWLTPLMAFVIKINSKGPVFFLQKRHKKDGGIFTCIKFRSMYENAGEVMQQEHFDHLVTPVGRFIRKYHIDELPQLINVLAGDMSLVGPRPYMISENGNFEKLLKNYRFRHLVNPGITGLAQSEGFFGTTPDVEKMNERLQYDLHYVENWTLLLDARIMLNTLLITAGLKKKKRVFEIED